MFSEQNPQNFQPRRDEHKCSGDPLRLRPDPLLIVPTLPLCQGWRGRDVARWGFSLLTHARKLGFPLPWREEPVGVEFPGQRRQHISLGSVEPSWAAHSPRPLILADKHPVLSRCMHGKCSPPTWRALGPQGLLSSTSVGW